MTQETTPKSERQVARPRSSRRPDGGIEATSAARHRRRRGDDRGEGVISTAIAVLVMAFLGAAMWVTFNAVWQDTAENTENQVNIIGSDGVTP